MRQLLLVPMILVTSVSLYGASVTFYIGDVKILSKGAWQKVTNNRKVSKGDIIKTGKNSLAIISFPNVGKIKLNAKSQVAFSNLERRKIILNLSSGGIFSKIVKTQRSVYKVKARTITASVRGTQFYFSFGKQKGFPKNLWLCVNEGIVGVKENRRKKSVTVKAGEGVLIDPTGIISPPKKYRWTRKLNWNMDPEKGSVKEKTDSGSVSSDFEDDYF